jgi:hypothetical protein
MDFSDHKHYPDGFVFSGAMEMDSEQACRQEVNDALRAWSHRSSKESPGSELLQVDGCPLFSISYDGKANDYWPSESENDISETLIREFLYHDGIDELSDYSVHLFHVRYAVLTMTGDDCLLVCPYLTAGGNIAGIVVVTVTKKLCKHFLTS